MKTLLTIFTVFMLTGSVLIAKTYEKDKDGNVIQKLSTEEVDQRVAEISKLKDAALTRKAFLEKQKAEIDEKISKEEVLIAEYDAELDSLNQVKQ